MDKNDTMDKNDRFASLEHENWQDPRVQMAYGVAHRPKPQLGYFVFRSPTLARPTSGWERKANKAMVMEYLRSHGQLGYIGTAPTPFLNDTSVHRTASIPRAVPMIEVDFFDDRGGPASSPSSSRSTSSTWSNWSFGDKVVRGGKTMAAMPVAVLRSVVRSWKKLQKKGTQAAAQVREAAMH